MLNKVSTVSIMLIIAIGLIIFFGVKNGKCGQSTTKPTPPLLQLEQTQEQLLLHSGGAVNEP